jgi:hypothetical protein
MSQSQTETEKIINFAKRLRYVLELKINKLRTDMQKSNIRRETDMLIIRIQALEWVQDTIYLIYTVS